MQNIELANLKCVAYAQPIPLSVKQQTLVVQLAFQYSNWFLTCKMSHSCLLFAQFRWTTKFSHLSKKKKEKGKKKSLDIMFSTSNPALKWFIWFAMGVNKALSTKYNAINYSLITKLSHISHYTVAKIHIMYTLTKYKLSFTLVMCKKGHKMHDFNNKILTQLS